MTQEARISSTATSETERARQVEEAVHSVQMEGLDLSRPTRPTRPSTSPVAGE